MQLSFLWKVGVIFSLTVTSVFAADIPKCNQSMGFPCIVYKNDLLAGDVRVPRSGNDKVEVVQAAIESAIGWDVNLTLYGKSDTNSSLFNFRNFDSGSSLENSYSGNWVVNNGDDIGFYTLKAANGFIVNFTTSANNGEYSTEGLLNNGGKQPKVSHISFWLTDNFPPSITSAPVIVATQLVNYDYNVDATDPDPFDVLTFSLVDAPVGMQINPQTGIITWMPTTTDTATVTVKVTDLQGAYDTQTYSISIEQQGNQAPNITSSPVLNSVINHSYEYQVTAQDPNPNDILTYSFALGEAPASMHIDPVTGLIRWIPTSEGIVPVTIKVSDQLGLFDTQSYELLVSPAQNLPPEIISMPSEKTQVATNYEYDIEAIDPNNDEITYQLETAPSNSSINTITGELTWEVTQAYNPGNLELNSQCLISNEDTVATFGDAEILVVIDESGSMSGEQSWIGNMMPALDVALNNAGVGEINGNRYGLIGYGNSRVVPRSLLMPNGLYGNAQEFEQASKSLMLNGGTEDGWSGIDYALRNYEQGDRRARNVILITDEDRDNTNSAITYASTLRLLNEQDALLNAVVNARFYCGDGQRALGVNSKGVGYVVDGTGGYVLCENTQARSGSGATVAHYVNMAIENGGAAWDLDFLRRGGHYAESFSKALIDIKVEEILEQLPPAPASDLVVSDLIISDNGTSAVVEVLNRGLSDTPGGSSLSVYSSTQLLTEVELEAIPAGQSSEIVIALEPSFLTGDIKTVITPSANVVECSNDNNESLFALFKAIAIDSSGLSDTQFFTMNALSENHAPIILSDPNTIARVNLNYNYLVLAKDADLADGLTYQLKVDEDKESVIPDEMTIDGFTGEINWIPQQSMELQTYHILIEVSDLLGFVSQQEFDITVSPEAIKLFSPGQQNSYIGDPVLLQLLFNSAPDSQLQFSANGLPNGLSINSEGLITGTTTVAAVTEVEITVVDTVHNTQDTISFDWLVTLEPNAAPEIVSMPNTQAGIDTLYEYHIVAQDLNDDALEFSLSKAPLGMLIDDNGKVTWIPILGQQGQHVVTINVTDGALTTIQEYILTVSQPDLANSPPIITSNPAGQVFDNNKYSYAVEANDVDGDVVIVSLVNGPQGMTLTDDYIVEWTPTEEQIGMHPVEVQATDGNYIYSQKFNITVLKPSTDNSRPIVTSTPATLAIVDKEYTYQVIAEDADGDGLIFSLANAPSGMTISSTGTVKYTPTANQQGEHQVTVAISDTKVVLSQAYMLRVVEEPTINHAPVFTQLPTTAQTNIDLGRDFYTDVNATDPDGDHLNFELIVQDNLLGLSIDSNTGEMNAFPTTDSQLGEHIFKVRVADNNGGWAEFTSKIIVYREGTHNASPIVTSTPKTLAQVGENYTYQMTVTDPENDGINFSVISGPFSIDQQSGSISWQPTEADLGAHQVIIEITDSFNAKTQQRYSLYVQGAGDNSPHIISTPKTEHFLSDGSYQYQVVAEDVDRQAVTYQLLAGPGSIDNITGMYSFLPGDIDIGEHHIVVKAIDSDGYSSEQSFALMVIKQGPWNHRVCRL